MIISRNRKKIFNQKFDTIKKHKNDKQVTVFKEDINIKIDQQKDELFKRPNEKLLR